MPTRTGRRWQFKARFRRQAFGWKSQPAIVRIREAVSEIKQVARTDPIDAAEGAVTFVERLSPALENVDSSSGAIGTAVNNAIAELVPIIAEAPADETTRAACLSALLAATRHDEILELVERDSFWPYKRWAVKALVAQGRHGDALRYAETCRNPWASDAAIDAVCEQILLSTGHIDDAYARYALTANRAATYVAWFRAIAKKYPHKPAATILSDLVRLTSGDEGKWFAAAKEARLFDEAIALANQAPCDPRTLTRAARDFAEKNPAFATEAGMAALHWLIQGHGYEITSADVWAACSNTLRAARNAGRGDEARARIQALVDNTQPRGDSIAEIIGRWAGQDPQ